MCEGILRPFIVSGELPGWSFRFDGSVRRFGCCKYTRKEITLSAKLTELNNESDVRDTMLHEIAHALLSKAEGHGYLWKETVKKLGGKPERCYSGKDIKTPEKSFRGTCPGCQRTIERFKRMQIACGRCCKKHNGGKFTNDYKFNWERK